VCTTTAFSTRILLRSLLQADQPGIISQRERQKRETYAVLLVTMRQLKLCLWTRTVVTCVTVRLGTSNDPSEREPDVEEVHSKEISGLGNEVEVLPVVHNAIELQFALPDENVIREYYDEELDQEGGERVSASLK